MKANSYTEDMDVFVYFYIMMNLDQILDRVSSPFFRVDWYFNFIIIDAQNIVQPKYVL